MIPCKMDAKRLKIVLEAKTADLNTATGCTILKNIYTLGHNQMDYETALAGGRSPWAQQIPVFHSLRKVH